MLAIGPRDGRAVSELPPQRPDGLVLGSRPWAHPETGYRLLGPVMLTARCRTGLMALTALTRRTVDPHRARPTVVRRPPHPRRRRGDRARARRPAPAGPGQPRSQGRGVHPAGDRRATRPRAGRPRRAARRAVADGLAARDHQPLA